MITYALIHACCFFFCLGFLSKKKDCFDLDSSTVVIHVILFMFFAPFTASVIYGHNFYSAD